MLFAERNCSYRAQNCVVFFSFIQAVEYGLFHFIWSSLLRALTDDGRLCANEGVLLPLPYGMQTSILKRGLLRLIDDCVVDVVLVILALAKWARLTGRC